MDLIKISAVSYLNTFPFVFGLKTSGELDDIDLQLDIPSVCAEKLKTNKVDLALVPVGAIPELKDPIYVADYCIGAEREVRSVLLLSHVPLQEIREIALDFDSRTSVQLIRVLAGKFWKIDPQWRPLGQGEAENPVGCESLVAIGDKTFQLVDKFPFVYDLAAEWISHTSLPFVFAVWLANKPLPEGFLRKFNKALEYGILHKKEVPDFFPNRIPKGLDAISYLENNISYPFDERKKEGMNLFLKMISKSAISD
ncbi:MAG: menaquinone biosynthesis protein [Bacteroidales bacterium]|nr:menaquinone biosynthesis protein [Bacteroidales bacterium]